MIHLIRERTGHDPGKAKVPFTLYARCGVSVKLRNPNERQPPEFTAWTADVTCLSCLADPPRAVSVSPG